MHVGDGVCQARRAFFLLPLCISTLCLSLPCLSVENRVPSSQVLARLNFLQKPS